MSKVWQGLPLLTKRPHCRAKASLTGVVVAILIGSLAACTANGSTGSSRISDQAAGQSSGPSKPSLGKPLSAPSGLDVHAADAWQSACRITATDMNALLQGAGIGVVSMTAKGTTNDECMYSDSDPNNIDSFGVSVEALGPSYGFGTSGEGGHDWSGSDSASGYASACAQSQASSTGLYEVVCDPSIGDGVVIARDRTDAVLFVPGSFFYVLTFYSIDDTDSLTRYYEAVAQKLAALPPLT
jgi:hypothetical protein